MVTIDKVLLINLKKRPDRLASVQQELNCSSILKNYTRVEAIDGLDLSDNEIKEHIHAISYNDIVINKKSNGLYLTRGAVGLALTYKNILENINNNTLILEDDIKIDTDFDNIVRASLAELPENWDILYLGWHPSRHIKLSTVSNYIKQISGQINGTHAWMINPRSAIKFLKMFPIRYQIDTELYRLSNINRYCIYKNIVYITSSTSNIQI